jgi:galactokinase
MSESCRSSIEQYECGSEAVHDLQRIVSSTEGVLGSRFSGGGFGGCVVGLVAPSHAQRAIVTIKDSYLNLHPEVADRAAVYLATSVNGVRFL